MADLTLGLQRLEIKNDVAGSGTLEIDAGAILVLDGAVASSQVIDFAPNTSAQLGQDPYTPSTLVLAAPPTTATITGFTYADRIVLSNVTRHQRKLRRQQPQRAHVGRQHPDLHR